MKLKKNPEILPKYIKNIILRDMKGIVPFQPLHCHHVPAGNHFS